MMATPEAYIAAAPETRREAFQRLLAAIRSAVPDARRAELEERSDP